MTNKLYVVGMGPGKEEMMTGEALFVLEQADVIIGYTIYLKLLGERFQEKELLSTPMRQETERCQLAFKEAEKGKKVAFICSGDAGIYGMASLMYEIGKEYPEIELETDDLKLIITLKKDYSKEKNLKLRKKHLTYLILVDIIIKSLGEVAELVEGAALEML